MTETYEVILTHEHTDFDALASLLAASLLFPQAIPVLPRRINRNVMSFLERHRSELPFITPKEVAAKTGGARISRAILVDTNGANLVKGMDDETTRYVIDHHSRNTPLPDEWEVWTEAIGANTTLLVEKLMESWGEDGDTGENAGEKPSEDSGEKAGRIELTPVHATLLALGIHEDTGSLTYASATARDARCLSWLLQEEHGVDLSSLSGYLHFPLSRRQQQLLHMLQEQSEFLEIGPYNVLVAQAEALDFHDEFSALVSRMRDNYEVDAVFLLFQKQKMVQVVARSTTDGIDVGQITRELGGGGHVRAAAAPVRNASLPEVRERLIELLRRTQGRSNSILAAPAIRTDEPVRVSQIMSVGRPQTLPPEMTVNEALALMRRYGHEGFPVVRTADGTLALDERDERDEQTGSLAEEATPLYASDLLGLVTRRELDRAFDHNMGGRAIRRFMRTGTVTVRPDQTVDELRSIITNSGWGQIPVVEPVAENDVAENDVAENDVAENDAVENDAVEDDVRIIGIVTRTDLIRSGNQAVQPPYGAETVVSQLARLLSPWHLFLLRLLGREAGEMGFIAYVVGGFVRDLLLNEESYRAVQLDVDTVMEGDAIAYARRIQRRYGGRMVEHRRFGTANWLLGDDDQPLDLAALEAARIEGDGLTENALTLDDLPAHLDFVTARTEFYTAPTALPTVERGSIKLDLYRRDFTINTLAVCLNPERWGELLDFYGGLHDLERGIVRVLHSLSFVDDPTRILRAVRYEQRFGFRIESRTLELLSESLSLLKQVSGARIRHEIDRTLQEETPEDALLRLDELGVLTQLHPDLYADAWIRDIFPQLRTLRGKMGEAGEMDEEGEVSETVEADKAVDEGLGLVQQLLRETPVERLYWGLLVYPVPAASDEALIERLGLRKETARLLAGLRQIQAHRDELADPATARSRCVTILDRAAPEAVALACVACEVEAVHDVLIRYLAEWRHVSPLLDGNDLLQMEIPRGPFYSQILRALRNARLDGKLETRGEEEALVRQLVSEAVDDAGETATR